MPTVFLPRQLSRLTNGQSSLTRGATHLNSLIEDLCLEFPQLRDVLFDEDARISPFVGVFVEGVQIDADEPSTVVLALTSTIHIVTAIAGG
jgi:hypothetical protein